jgi:hypothetical protein
MGATELVLRSSVAAATLDGKNSTEPQKSTQKHVFLV